MQNVNVELQAVEVQERTRKMSLTVLRAHLGGVGGYRGGVAGEWHVKESEGLPEGEILKFWGNSHHLKVWNKLKWTCNFWLIHPYLTLSIQNIMPRLYGHFCLHRFNSITTLWCQRPCLGLLTEKKTSGSTINFPSPKSKSKMPHRVWELRFEGEILKFI